MTTAGRVVRVLDGDTLEFEIRRTVRVRLLDCWAPETRTRDRAEKARGLASKKHLQQLCEDRDGVLHIPAAEQGELWDVLTMGRVLGHVWVADDLERSVSSRQVAAGHATETRAG